MSKLHYTNIASKYFGLLAEIRFPKLIQKILNSGYVKVAGIDLSEFQPAADYESLQALFTRNLAKARKFSKNKTIVISPTDSKVVQFGVMEKNSMLQVKGVSYNINMLLTENAGSISKVIDGSYISLYLSPKDYHHFHVPCDMKINKIVHVPGRLYSVRPALQNKKEIFVRNERVILECIANNKLLYMVLVGATMVGKISLKFSDIETNTKSREIRVINYKKPLNIKKGDNMGCFKLGSSVVLVFEKGTISFKDVSIGKEIRFGDSIAVFLRNS